jgi:hypothetical protein
VPTVVVGTDEFQALAQLEARNRGLAELPLALVKHPLGGIRDDEVLRKADTIVDAVAQAVSVAHTAGGV